MQEFLVGKMGNSNMTPSEESMILMTSYRLPYHGNRFFAVALNDALPMSSLQVQILHIHFG